MAIDKNKLLQQAEKLVRQGKLDQAISLYEQVMEASPRDMNLKNKVGDLYVRAGSIPGAVKVFDEVADFFAEEGFYFKAIAIYKKINRLDPSAINTYFKLAELYHKQGLNNDAKGMYQQVADLYSKEGDQGKAAAALEQLLKLDPDNPKVRMRLAELYAKTGQSDKALAEYQHFGTELMRKGMIEEAVKIFERGLAGDEGHAGLAAGLVRALHEGGHSDRAVERGRVLFGRHRENAPLLAAMAEAYRKLNQLDLARQAYDRLVALEPDNPEWKARLGEARGEGRAAAVAPAAAEARRAPSPPAGSPEGVPDFSEMTGDYNMEELAEVSGEWGPEDGETSAPAAVSAEHPSVEAERDEFIVEHLTEAEVFIKYGLIEKAIDNLEAIVNHYPDELETLRRLKDLYLETGNKPRAAEKCVQLARIARAKGEMDRAMELLAEARAHDPAVRLEPAPSAAIDASVPEYSFSTSSVVVDIDSGPPASGVDLDLEATTDKPTPAAPGERTETIEFSLDEAQAEEEPAGIELDFEPGEKAQGAAEEGIEFFDNAIRAPRREAKAGSTPAATSGDDSLFDQEEAFLTEAAEAPASAEVPAGGSAALGEESLEEIFKEFKKGVEEQVDTGDYETHYNLGLAYRDMELVDEAIAEFQLASKDPNRFVECCSNLAICFNKKGLAKIAIKWCQKGLESLDMESPQYIALLYDLGDAQEAAGDPEKALEAFTDVYGLDAGFRDVSERINRLQG